MNRRAFLAAGATLAVAPAPTVTHLGSVNVAWLTEALLREHLSRFLGPPTVECVRDYEVLKTGRIVIRINSPGGSLG